MPGIASAENPSRATSWSPLSLSSRHSNTILDIFPKFTTRCAEPSCVASRMRCSTSSARAAPSCSVSFMRVATPRNGCDVQAPSNSLEQTGQHARRMPRCAFMVHQLLYPWVKPAAQLRSGRARGPLARKCHPRPARSHRGESSQLRSALRGHFPRKPSALGDLAHPRPNRRRFSSRPEPPAALAPNIAASSAAIDPPCAPRPRFSLARAATCFPTPAPTRIINANNAIFPPDGSQPIMSWAAEHEPVRRACHSRDGGGCPWGDRGLTSGTAPFS